MANAGDGYHVHISGLTHDQRGYPVITADAHEKLVKRLVDKIRVNAEKIYDWEERQTKDADIVIIAYGITARVVYQAITDARKEGIKVGIFRPKVIWPFPEPRIRELSKTVKSFLVPEINYGQIYFEVRRCVKETSNVIPMNLMGGRIHTPNEISDGIRKAVKK
jgi:2-oxoglutarate ferredoxin oxidoreductase subunit alpha